MEKEEAGRLIEKLLSGKITTEEKTQLEKWYDSFEADSSYTGTLSDLEKSELERKLFHDIDQNIKRIEDKAAETKTLEQSGGFRRRIYPGFYKSAAAFMV